MSVEEMEAIFKREGWTVHRRKRRKLIYIYAARRNGLKVEEMYVAPLSKIKEMTSDQIISILQKSQKAS